MAGSIGSISQYFPDVFGAGAPMSAAGSAATTSTAATAATGAGSMALGPWMAASAGIQGLTGLIGNVMGQTSEDRALQEANKNIVRGWGFDLYSQDRDKANQMAALREGNYFMQSPIYQQNKKQDFSHGFMLAGKLDPYLTAMAGRLG